MPRNTSIDSEEQAGREEQGGENTRQDRYFGEMKTAINIICYQHKMLRSMGLQLKNNDENLKVKFVERLLYYWFGLMKAPSAHVQK